MAKAKAGFLQLQAPVKSLDSLQIAFKFCALCRTCATLQAVEVR